MTVPLRWRRALAGGGVRPCRGHRNGCGWPGWPGCLSWVTLGWLGVEAGVAIGAAVIAGSVALLGFGLDSGIEAMAARHRDLAVDRNPAGQRADPNGAPSGSWP